MKKYKRQIPTVEEFTGVDMYGVESIVYGEDKNEQPLHAYNLYQLADRLKIKKVELLADIPSIYLFEGKNEYGHEALFITDDGLYLLLNQFSVNNNDFKIKSTDILLDMCQYGISADEQVREGFEYIRENNESLDIVYKFIDGLIE